MVLLMKSVAVILPFYGRVFWYAGFIGLLLLNTGNCHAGKTSESLVIITDTGNSVRELSFHDLRAIYALRMQTWPDGKAITVYSLPDHDSMHMLFCKNVLKTLPQYLRQNWDRQVFSGAAAPPIIIRNSQIMKELIAQTPGAIGYVLASQVDSSVVPITIKP